MRQMTVKTITAKTSYSADASVRASTHHLPTRRQLRAAFVLTVLLGVVMELSGIPLSSEAPVPSVAQHSAGEDSGR